MSRTHAWVLALVVISVAGGCLTVTPGGALSPSASTTASPSASATELPRPTRSRRPRPTATLPTVTLAPTAPPTTAPTAPPTTATLPPTAPPTSGGELDFLLPPVYPAVQLTSGFQPDPHTLSVTAGGPVDVAYLGGSCVGFATSEPTFELAYTNGAQSLLRFYFVGTLSRDSTMIINKPDGEYVCADDTFNTVHPSIDFDSPETGTYDVWIGAFVGGTDVAGTLSVTEIADNHP